MDALKHAFFEDATYVYVALIFAELAIAAVWHEVRKRWAAILLIVPPVLAGATFLVERVVVTDREKIVAATEEIAASVETGRLDAILPHLHEDFRARVAGVPLTKPMVEAAVRSRLVRYEIQSVNLHRMEVEIEGDRARMHVNTIFRYGPEGAQRYALVWDLRWERVGERWLILDVDPPQPGLEL